MKLDPKLIDEQEARLTAVANQLKSEFFGLDETIDRVINSVKAWYTFPEIIQRPVIVCLWGLTGVGKTQLVRRLVALLGFQNKFVEVQMDGITSSNSNHEKTLGGLLSDSSIEEGEPGILLLDEFQRYRTVSKDDHDVKVERFQDVWMLLSDGKFSSSSTLFGELEMMLAMQTYNDHYKDEEEEEEEEPKKKFRKSMLYPYEARSLKRRLKLTQSIHEIMQWEPGQIAEKIIECKEERAGLQVDYSKLLIFVSGNLDEAYTMMANAVDDCDTDADIYYELSKKVSVTEIKGALAARFKPEQIARFGNNHIIYTSLSRSTYIKLIDSTCEKYLAEMERITGIVFTLTDNAKQEIYDNSVYPSQGTRPVFSSIHKILSDGLVQFSFWAAKHNFDYIDLDIDAEKSVLHGYGSVTRSSPKKYHSVHVDLDIRSKKKKTTKDFTTLVAVHEAGHGLVYALLKKTPPREIKVNPASYKGGYTTHQVTEDKARGMQEIKDDIAVLYAGTVAEQIVFGEPSAGCGSDLDRATMFANDCVRNLGMDEFPGVISSDQAIGNNNKLTFLTNEQDSNSAILVILKEEKHRAEKLIKEHLDEFKMLVNRLLEGTTLQGEEFTEMFPDLDLQPNEKTGDYHDWWDHFTKTH